MSLHPTTQNAATSNRRSFLQASTLAAGGVLAAAKASTLHAAGSDVIKVGLVGCGGRGSGAANEILYADKGIELVAMADLFKNQLDACRDRLSKRYADQCKVPDDQCFVGYDAYKDLLKTDIQAVLLASPPYYRPDHLEAAVAAGKQVFCEKPVAVDPDGVRRVLAASAEADKKGLNLVSGLCWRYHSGMVETVKRVQNGDIGKLITSQHNYLTSPVWVRAREPQMDELTYQCWNWYNYTWLSGDHIVEQFIHSLDKAMWLHNDVPPVRCIGLGGRAAREPEGTGDIYDHFHVVYEWADGTRAYANTRQIPDCKNETEDYVFGSSGSSRLIANEITGSTPWKFEGKVVQMHQAEQIEFAKAMRGDRERINNGVYMSYSTLMAIMGREACYSGSVITWEQAMNSPQKLGPESLTKGPAPEVKVKVPGIYKFPV